MAFTSELLPTRAFARKSVLASALFLALTSVAAAQETGAMPACSYQGEDVLLTVTNPPLEDRQLIMDLIHRFFWALDKPTMVGVDKMFVPDTITYELCNAAFTQLQKKTGWEQLRIYLRDVERTMGENKSFARHFENNTLLNVVDNDTVEGKTAVLVTIQFAGIEVPILDYTATMLTQFKRDGAEWKFSKITLIGDGPKITLRAR
jgi:hypothetical protein